MSRFQVVLAGLLASAVTGLICSAGVLLLGMVGSFLATTDWDVAVDEVGTLVLVTALVGAIGAAVGVLMGVAPVMLVAVLWDRVQAAVGTQRAIASAVLVVAAVVLVEVAVLLGWWFENDSVREAMIWSLTCAGLAAATGFISLHAAWRSVRRRRADLPLGY